ncbi:MAG: HlyD family secretion protein [Planctomycetota bacterium]
MLRQLVPKLVTGTLIAAACLCAYLLYRQYAAQPWTRDGQVRANVVKIAPRVSGYLVDVHVTDNQFVNQGDLLFQIDQSSYQLAVQDAQVELDDARENVEALEAAVRAAEALVKQKHAAVDSARGKVDAAKASVKSAEATVREAETGVTSAHAVISQVKAQLDEAEREAQRARRLAQKQAGSIEVADAKESAGMADKAESEKSEASLQQAQAAVIRSKASLEEAQAQLVISQSELLEAQTAVETAGADKDQADATLGVRGEQNVRIRNAKVKLAQAELNLKWTSIFAPADGYITNMSLLPGTFVSPGTAFALFVDRQSFRVDGYFQETKLKNIKPGDSAIVTLMGHRDQRLEGEVESIGYAINPPDVAETEGPENLIPTIEPTFEWIRLAQRVPVRIRLKNIPPDLHLVAGTTVSIAIQE